MPDPQVNRVELSVTIPEADLLAFLLGRYNQEDLAKAGIKAPTSIIRSMDMVDQGICEFRICSMSFINVEELLATIRHQEALLASAAEARIHEESGEHVLESTEPPMQGHAIRIKKSKKGSN